MRKSYSFKKLGLKIQRLAAIMLITLMAVSNAFAQYDGTGLFTKINSLDELTSGYYVVTDATGEFAMLNTGTNYINKTSAVFFNPPANIVWYVNVNSNGEVTLYNEEAQVYAALNSNGNAAHLLGEVSGKCYWTPSIEDNGFVLTNNSYTDRMLRYNPSSPRFACYTSTSTNVRRLALYKQGPAPAVMAPTFNIPTGTYYTMQTVELNCLTPGANVYYSVNGSEPVLYTVPFTVNATAEVTAYATLGEDQSLVSTLTLTFPTPLANIAAFYTAENGPYTITSDMTFVYRHGRYMYVKDATGGLLIYDNVNSIITTEYNEGDVFTGGITGTRTLYNGLVEIVPALNTAEGTAGTAVDPIEVTFAQLLASPNDYMSKLVVVKNGTFNGGVLNNTSNPKKFSQDGNDIIIYNRFGNITSAMVPEGQTATVVGFVSIYNGAVQLFPRDANDIALTSIPFISNFEGAGSYTWMLANGDNTNKWYVGQAAGFDNNMLYISSSNGYTNKYNVTAASVTHAYIPVTLPANDVLLTFDLRSVGEANDYVQVSVMDEIPVAGTLPTDYLARYYGVNDFTTETVLIPAENAGEKYLVFTWNNNASAGTQQPAAIDNVTLKNTCEMVTDINANVNERTAVLTWTAPAGQNSWTVMYKDVNSDEWMSTNVTSATLTLNDLTTNTAYDVRIRSNCGAAASNWATYQFDVPCINVIMGDVEVAIGDGTATTYYAPFSTFYKNSWSQTIYPASYFETPGFINSLSWEVNAAVPHEFQSLKIYLGTTTHENNTSTTDWLPMEDLTLVYEATNGTIGTVAGWETYQLNTPFYYNADENLVVVVSRKADNYKSLYYKATGGHTNAVMYRWNDSNESYGDHPGTATATSRNANLPNMKVDYTGYICDDDLCKVPTNLAVEHHVANSIVTWVGVPGANTYEVQYAETGSDWNTATVTGATTFILANLTEGASYDVRVRTVCGEDSYSHWTDLVTFTRPVYCDIPAIIIHQNVTSSQATLKWPAGDGTSWVVEYGEEGFTLGGGTQLTTTTPTITLTGLTAETSYDVYVKANCGGYLSTWSDVHTFTTDCEALTVTVANPWFEDFESYTGSGEKPFHCWLTPVKTYNGGPFVYCNYSSASHSGGNSAELKGYNNMLVLPAFTNDIHTLALSFWATAVTPSEGTLEVGVLTDVDDEDSFEFVAYATNPSSRNGVGNFMGSFSFENVTAPAGRIALRYQSNNGISNSWNLDDFTVYIPQNCNAPVNLAAEVNVPDAEAVITWNPFGEETAWQVQYGAAGFALGTGTVVDVTNPTYTMTGLTEGASYDVYVRTMCSATETSVWGGPITFEVANACAQYCTYTLNLNDSYGDGWNGGVLTITQDGAEIGSYTIADGYSATYTVDLCSGSEFLFSYTPGSYAYENTMTVVDPDGTTVWNYNGTNGAATQTVTPTCGGCTTTCEYTLNLEDSYGDGWNGGTLTVSQNGEELGTYTISSGYSASYTLEICDGAEVVFAYTTGSYSYENTMTVLGPDGSTIWSHDGTNGSTTQTITASCGGVEPEPCVTCEYTFELTDYYGDGWSGWSAQGSLDIVQGGQLVQTLTMSNGYTKTVNVPLCNAEEVTLTLHLDYYEDEMGLIVTAPDGTEIWNVPEGSLSGSDDVVYTFTPACVACDAPVNLVVDAVTSTSATLSWTGDTTATYNFYYKNMADNDWTMMDVIGTTVTLTLTANNTYVAKVKAACSSNEFTDEVTFFTTSATIECADYTISEQSGSGYYTPVNDYYKNSRSEQIYTPTEVGGAGNITKISFNYQGSSTMTKKTNVKMYLAHTTKSEFSSTTDWTTSGLTLVYTGNLNCSTGWNEFVLDEAFAYNGTDNLIVIVDDESGQYGSSSNKFYYTNCTGYKCLTFQNDSYTWTNHSSKTGTRRQYRPDIRFNLCSAGTDVALMGIHNIPNGCDLSNLPVSIDIKAAGESAISTIEAYYRVNESSAVHETITLAEPMNQGDEMTYMFNTLATLPLSSNTITVWIETPNDGDVANNILTAGPIENINPASIPFVETFNAGEINDGWFIRDLNADEVTFTIANGVASYPYSDEVAANDWLMTTCMDIYASSWNPGVYDVSYSYKANDPTMTEKFSVYYGEKIGDDYLMLNQVATHEFHNGEYVTVHNIITVAQAGTYYFGIHAESAPGNAGFQIDNFNIKSAVNVTVNAGANGSTNPSGSFYMALGEECTITIVPDFGYHVAAIYKNNMLVRGENTDNAAIEYYTFTASSYNLINVTFAPNKYEVNAIVENQYVTAYNNNAPGAIYTPNHEVVSHGGSHSGIFTIQPHFHFVALTVNGMDYTDLMTDLGNGQYALTVSPIFENKNINVVVDLDSSTIVYTVKGGQGIINNEFVVDANTQLPATYTVTLPGYSDLLSTITPAPGFHVDSIFVDGVDHSNIDIYSFEYLLGNHTVEVTFAPNHYVITTNGFGYGTVSDGVEFDYDPNYTYTFTATPATGYSIATLTRNNVALTVADPSAAYSETLTNILDNYDYVVTFAPSTYTVTASCGNNGTISPLGSASYLYHQNAVYNINAAQGYYIASVTVDGTTTNYTQADALTTTTYTFDNIEANHVINVTFAQFIFTVTVNAGANGAITPATANFAYGATPTFTITPDAGYSIADVTVDGASIGAVATYTFLPLDGNHTIAATFTANSYTIAATAGNGGTITPAGNTTVAYNANQAYTISANAGYHVSDVFVDGVSVGAVNTYTFTGVTANHTIYAAFESNEYTVTVNQPAHGTITPGTTTVLYGATPSFVITPAVGYNVTAITVNGTNVTLANVPHVNGIYTYTFAAINANQTLTATMTAKTYTITASAGSNGSITPNGNTTVNYGASQAYTITPANGYVIDNVTVDNISMGAVSSYVFTNVAANHTIAATFKAADCEVPTFLYTTHIDETSAMLHWSHPTATTFDIQYKTPTSNFTSVANVSGNSYQLTDLTPNTNYMWQVRAHCIGGNSDWANLVTFTTDASTIIDGIEDLVKGNIKVYAEHQNVHILNNEGMNIENVRIFDAYGKLVYSGAVNTSHEVINLNVAAGAYIVNVTTDEGVANYKVTILK
jgi:hypothetical protein